MKVRTAALPIFILAMLLCAAVIFLAVAAAEGRPDPCEMPDGHPDPVGWTLYC